MCEDYPCCGHYSPENCEGRADDASLLESNADAQEARAYVTTRDSLFIFTCLHCGKLLDDLFDGCCPEPEDDGEGGYDYEEDLELFED